MDRTGFTPRQGLRILARLFVRIVLIAPVVLLPMIVLLILAIGLISMGVRAALAAASEPGSVRSETDDNLGQQR